MRKSLIVLLAFFVAAGVCLAAAFQTVSAGQDQIVVTETTLAGNAAAAEGLSVQTVLNESQQLFWRTTHAVSEQPNAVTEFSFYGTRQDSVHFGDEITVWFEAGNFNYSISGVIDLEQLEQEEHDWYENRMLPPARDVASRTAAGETRTERLPLNRYYAYYPVYLWSDCLWTEDIDEISAAHRTLLHECFRIPVPDSETVEVTVTKDEAGQVVGVECNSCIPEDGETTWIGAEPLVTEDAVYLLLTGNADFSQFRDGYGLYRIPISVVSSAANMEFDPPMPYLEVENMENVYPLDPSVSAHVSLQQGLDSSELLLMEATGTGTVVRVLDTADCQVREQWNLEGTQSPVIWRHEALLLFSDLDYGEPGRLMVLRRENGRYSLWLETDFYPLNDDGYYYRNLVFAFDGKRLAMADFASVYDTGSHRVTVYDQSGLCYAGDYRYSTNDLQRPLSTINIQEPLVLRWEEAF